MRRMKVFLVWLCLCGVCSSVAAQNVDRGDKTRNPEEMRARHAERLADEFKLKDGARADFVALYKNYMQDMAKYRSAWTQQADPSAKKVAEMTDDEARTRVQEEFDRKAQAIVDMYNRLDTEKKYHEKFSKMLSPKQLVRIFAPERNPRGGMRGMQPGGARSGGRMGGRGFGGGNDGFGGGGDWND